MAKTEIPSLHICSVAANPPLSRWASLLLLPLFMVVLLPAGFLLREILHPLIGRNGLILAAGLFGIAWMAYEFFKPQLLKLWPADRYEFDDESQTLVSSLPWWLATTTRDKVSLKFP
jgi:hypothetical protein